jgi:phage terminase large subunit GpA-like protein
LHYVRTGEESPLKKSVNTDLGAPYLPMAIANRRSADHLMSRLEDWERGTVPKDVRFITPVVDVQGHKFRVNVFGWGAGLQSWLIDRLEITASNRKEGEKYAGVEPASYAEDWQVLVEHVLNKAYALAGRPGVMYPLIVGCDSGGKEGVTEKAYEFYRWLRARRLHERFRLVKGVGNMNAPRTQETYPDARGRKTGVGRGDVPVHLLNVNVIKDGVWGDLGREEPGPGYVHLARWTPDEYFAEIASEQRTVKGWEKEKSKLANEDFDLHGYARALCVMVGAERINWQAPPPWASDWETNPLVVFGDSPRPLAPAAPAAPTRGTRNAGIQL